MNPERGEPVMYGSLPHFLGALLCSYHENVFNTLRLMSSGVEMDIHDIVKALNPFEAVHSIMWFGSSVRGEATEDSDIDICIIEEPGYTLKLKEKLRIIRELPEKVDVSFFHDLPLNIRQEVLQEGEIIYTKGNYYVYTLIKETDFEMVKYRRMQEEYHKEVMKRVKKRLATRR